MRGHLRNRKSGFTVIEVLIVLAIAGFILVMVLVATPVLRRNTRNHHRKSFVDLTASELDSYASQHNGTYPDDGASICEFINDYLVQPAGGDAGGCTFIGGSTQCWQVKATVFSLCYHDRENSSHAYPVTPTNSYDEISIMLSHLCNPTFDNSQNASDIGNPHVNSSSIGDTDIKRYVVWTPLEHTNYYCVDNSR